MQGVAAAMGPPCNAVSIKNHIAKLRAMAREQKLGGDSSDPGSASGNNATTTTTTPKKGGTQKTKDTTKAKGGAKKSAAAKKADKAAGGASDGENGSDEAAKPKKKAATNGVKKGRVSNKRKNAAAENEYVKCLPAWHFPKNKITDCATIGRTVTLIRRSRRRKRALVTTTPARNSIHPLISSMLNSTPLTITKSRRCGQRRPISLE